MGQGNEIMKLIRIALAAACLVSACLLLWGAAPIRAQNVEAIGEANETAEARKEQIAADRFLQLLKQRPRLGTALDRVYGYHVGRGTLEEFCKSLEADAKQHNDGRLWLILGMVQMQRGDDTAAAASLRKAAELLPEEPLASYYLGKTLVLLGDVENAVIAMRTAIERKPARADMLAIFQDLGRLFQRTGRNDEALQVWQQLETQFPNDPQVQEEIARILAEEGALAAAIERYAALSKSSTDRFRQVEMAIRAAQLKAQLGKKEEALSDFELQLGKVNPDSWLHRDVRRRIEEVFWSSGDIDGLVAYYTSWVEKHPEDVDAMMRTARFLAVQRRLPEAETWFRKAIEKSPSTAEPRVALAEALVADEQYGKAADEMKALVEIEPDNPDYIVRWGELVLNDSGRNSAERKSEAAEIWKRLLEKRGDDPVTVSRVADLLRSSESSEEAIAQYRKAIELAPNEPQYREYLGEYLHQLGRKDEAIAVWQDLASGERQTRDNLVRLSEVFSTFGYDDRALATMAAACEQKPTFGHRARYAELLREAGKYDESLSQLQLAEPLADDPELRQIVVDERIKNYQASGKLAETIDQLEAAVAGDKAGDAQSWRLLALLREADRQFQPACEAAEKATSLAPGNATMWETAALLQERSGRFGDAIESYRKLATIDRRFLSNYLTQIASLEMRVGNTEAALKAGEELIAAAPDNAEHYRFFADVCFRVGEEERGFEVLRRSVRGNPNDSEALLYLARVLSEAFRTDEAIELYWRGFDLAKDLDGKIAVITPLTELYLRTNRFETLTDRLEATGREQNKPRDGLLWVAAAHQAAGDLGTAKQMLEQLVREESRDTKLLEQMVALSRAEYDFDSAAEYQRRLVAIAPTPEGEYQLANILLELGEIEQSEAIWLKIAQRKNDSTSLTDAITTLVGKEQYETAAAIIDKSLASEPENWEVLTQAMLVYAKLDRGEEARRIAQRVLELNVVPSEPSQKTKEAIARRASRRNVESVGYDPYAELGRPSQQMQTVQRLKSIMSGSRDMYYGGSRQPIAPTCFADARAIARCMPLVAKEEGFKESEFVKTHVEKALAGGDEEQLWTAIFYIIWQNPQAQYGQTKDSQFEACLKSLVDRQDSDAAGLMLQSFVNRQRRSPDGSTAAQKPLTQDELKELSKLSELAGRSSGGNTSYYQLWVATEFARAGEEAEAEAIIDKYIESAKQSSNKYASLQAISVLLSDQFAKDISPRMLARCRDLFKSSLATATMTTSTQGGYGSVYERLMVELVEGDQLENALACVDDLLRWQAQQTADLRPSQRERLGQASAPIVYYRQTGGPYEQVTIAFPPPSSYFGTESIYMLYGLYEGCKADLKRLAQARAQIDQWAAESSDDPYLRLARIMAKASFAYWSGDRDNVMDTLAKAAD
jgi:tetratricopeptide (TPR) repeat protein